MLLLLGCKSLAGRMCNLSVSLGGGVDCSKVKHSPYCSGVIICLESLPILLAINYLYFADIELSILVQLF